MFSWNKEISKTIIFMMLDIIMVFLFTYIWFYLTDEKNVFIKSLGFTIAMQTFFFIYYFTYDALYEAYIR